MFHASTGSATVPWVFRSPSSSRGRPAFDASTSSATVPWVFRPRACRGVVLCSTPRQARRPFLGSFGPRVRRGVVRVPRLDWLGDRSLGLSVPELLEGSSTAALSASAVHRSSGDGGSARHPRDPWTCLTSTSSSAVMAASTRGAPSAIPRPGYGSTTTTSTGRRDTRSNAAQSPSSTPSRTTRSNPPSSERGNCTAGAAGRSRR